jgi:hypothetical protein
MIAAAVADLDVCCEDSGQQLPVTFVECPCVADGQVYYARSVVHDASIPQQFETDLAEGVEDLSGCGDLAVPAA